MSHPITIETFEARTIPLAEWNHRAHLTVAYLLLGACPIWEATGESVWREKLSAEPMG